MKMRSFLAKYRSTVGKPLIGDVLVSESCRYQRRTDAERRLSHVKELNGPHCEGEIVPSQQHPEILIHCGKVPSAQYRPPMPPGIAGAVTGASHVDRKGPARGRMTTGRSAAGRRSTEAEPPNLKLRMAPENETCRGRIQDDVLFRPVDGDIVLLHLGSGRYHGLEEVGARIWSLLADRPTTPQIVARLVDEYDVGPAVLDRDVSAFIESLRADGLIAACPD